MYKSHIDVRLVIKVLVFTFSHVELFHLLGLYCFIVLLISVIDH